jgi:2-dehydropantoate 2-reductase
VKKINSVLLAGAGAVGLTVASAIYHYDPDCIEILAGGERLAHYRRDGLFINGERANFKFAEIPVAESRHGAPIDLILIASKYHHLTQIIADIKPFVGADTVIVSLLNGISSEEIIGRVYGAERLPLAMILGTDAQHAGTKTTFSQRGFVHFGDADGKPLDRDRAIAEFFTRAGVPHQYHPTDMRRTLWYKFMANVGANQVSALLRLPYGPLKKDSPLFIPEAQALLESAMREVIAIANAEGISLNDGDIENWNRTVATLNDAGYTSMCQDVLAGRKTEVELFALTVMEYGKKHRVATPVNEALYRALRTIEQTYNLLSREKK